MLLPGKYFSTYEHEELGGGYGDMALGGMLMGTVHF